MPSSIPKHAPGLCWLELLDESWLLSDTVVALATITAGKVRLDEIVLRFMDLRKR